jgi:glycerol-3-phosphate dehydrogenase
LRKALTIKPTQMSKELNNIEYLLGALETAKEPFTKTTWSDTVDSWLGMRDLIKKLESERAQHVLDCIFSDKEVREALGAAVQFKKIANPDAPPDGLLIKLKAGPGKHIKDRYYDYVKALKTEMAHIERLQSLQKQATGLIAIGLLALGTGVGNFVVRVLSNKLFYDEWVPEQPAPAN